MTSYWLHLPRPYFQRRLSSQVPGVRISDHTMPQNVSSLHVLREQGCVGLVMGRSLYAAISLFQNINLSRPLPQASGSNAVSGRKSLPSRGEQTWKQVPIHLREPCGAAHSEHQYTWRSEQMRRKGGSWRPEQPTQTGAGENFAKQPNLAGK